MLITATGKEFECPFFVKNGGDSVFARLVGTTIQEVATVFSDPEETAILTDGILTVEGYTGLVTISLEDNAIMVHLWHKGENP